MDAKEKIRVALEQEGEPIIPDEEGPKVMTVDEAKKLAVKRYGPTGEAFYTKAKLATQNKPAKPECWYVAIGNTNICVVSTCPLEKHLKLQIEPWRRIIIE